MKLSAWGTLLFLAWSPLVAVTDGCSSQHEGERCDKMNGDVDCEAGLYCKRVYVQDYYWICCPVPPALASVAACNASGGPAPDGGGATDAGTSADNGDATSETGAPGGNDGASEASADRATNDTRVDMSVDMSVDFSLDTPPETNGDTQGDNVAPPDGVVPDDATSDEESDASDDLGSDALPPDDAISADGQDVADAPAADGPG